MAMVWTPALAENARRGSAAGMRALQSFQKRVPPLEKRALRVHHGSVWLVAASGLAAINLHVGQLEQREQHGNGTTLGGVDQGHLAHVSSALAASFFADQHGVWACGEQ